ncbi:MAG: glycosyltransferase [Candidatus Omnitrophota bacterium]
MKILFISSRLPFPPTGGDKLRVFHFIRVLSCKHEIHLLSFVENEEEKKYAQDLRQFCKSVETVLLKPVESYRNCLLSSFSINPQQLAYYRSSKMRIKTKEIIEKYKIDAVYAHLIRMAPYVQDLKIFKVLDLTDAISLSLKRSLPYRKHISKLYYFLEYLRVKRYEEKIIEYFDKSLLISNTDVDAIKGAKESKKIELVQNGVDLENLKPMEKCDNKKIAFVGNLHSFPNRDAVWFFYNEVLPLVKKEIPDIKFYVIGINPPPNIQELNKDANVVVTGPVDNLRETLGDSACFVCPIRNGAGLQNKILEAMSLGIPVVTTSIGFEGIRAEKDKDILVADKPVDFAGKIIEILKNKELREVLSKNARLVIEKNYSWDVIKTELERIFAI